MATGFSKTTQETTMALTFYCARLSDEDKNKFKTKTLTEISTYIRKLPEFQKSFISDTVLSMTLEKCGITYGMKTRSAARNTVNDIRSLAVFMLHTLSNLEKIQVIESRIDLTTLNGLKNQMQAIAEGKSDSMKDQMKTLAKFAMETFGLFQQIESLIGFDEGSLSKQYHPANMRNIETMSED